MPILTQRNNLTILRVFKRMYCSLKTLLKMPLEGNDMAR